MGEDIATRLNHAGSRTSRKGLQIAARLSSVRIKCAKPVGGHITDSRLQVARRELGDALSDSSSGHASGNALDQSRHHRAFAHDRSGGLHKARQNTGLEGHISSTLVTEALRAQVVIDLLRSLQTGFYAV